MSGTLADRLTDAFSDHPSEDDEDERIYLAISALNDAFTEGQFALVDAHLTRVNVTQIRPVVLLGILSMSWHAKEHLPSRPAFLAAVETRFRAFYGEERAERLLGERR